MREVCIEGDTATHCNTLQHTATHCNRCEKYVLKEIGFVGSDDIICVKEIRFGGNAAVCCSVLRCVAVCCSVPQCVAVCCNVLQCAAVCCSVLQCAAA